MRAAFEWKLPQGRTLRRTVAAGALLLAVGAAPSLGADDEEISIEALLKSGWEIAGYTSTVDNRSTFILFRHAGEPYLVQCRTGYDVTRSPRVHTNCYQLR